MLEGEGQHRDVISGNEDEVMDLKLLRKKNGRLVKLDFEDERQGCLKEHPTVPSHADWENSVSVPQREKRARGQAEGNENWCWICSG